MASNGFIRKLWNWFDNNFLIVATAFLIAFIPLYPKIPLGEIIPGYIVRIRLEDFFILFFFVWWMIQVVRKKVHWRTPLTLFIGAYLVTGLLSNVLGVVLTNSIPPQMLHIGKSMLHWARHVQYFSLFFIAYSAVKHRKHAFLFLIVLLATVISVVAYGYGQKYLYWPVYSTMNREFSKGVRLYLGPFARVQSTFAGHYDLGAYMALVLPLLIATFFGLAKETKELGRWWQGRWRVILRWTFFAAWMAGLWILVMSAARSSFIGYLVGAGLVVLLYWHRRTWKWMLTRGLVVLLISVAMMVFVGDLSSRFVQLIDQNKYPQVHSTFHALNDLRKHPEKLIGMHFDEAKRQPPQGAKSVDELEQELNEVGLTVSDTQPSTQRPADVYEDIPEQEFDLNDPAATLAGNLVEQDGKLVKERTYSICSLERSLSLCIRLETLWPRAIEGFLRNPIVGSGYATLTKESVEQFTEAESTDNNFLRTLGENGALGFFFYYGAMGLALWYLFKTYRSTDDPFFTALAVGLFGGTVGLMVNAMYIDVFVASKVAYTFWTLQGIALATFVKEGLVAQRFAFDRHAQQAETKTLSALLQQVEGQTEAKKSGKSGYVSKQKKRQKSTKRKKSVQRQK